MKIEREIYFLERAYADYWEFIRFQRNQNKENFVCQREIESKEHYEFMAKNWQTYWVLNRITHYGPDKCGFIGIVDNDIRFCVLKKNQGLGLGTLMLRMIKENYPKAIGKVKHDNIASQKAFEKAEYSCFKKDDEFCYYNISI